MDNRNNNIENNQGNQTSNNTVNQQVTNQNTNINNTDVKKVLFNNNNFLTRILPIIIVIIIIIILALYMFNKNNSSTNKNYQYGTHENVDNDYTNISTLDNIDLFNDAKIELDDTNYINNIFSMSFSNKFVKNPNTNYLYDYIYKTDNTNRNYMCRISFTKINSYKSIDEVKTKLFKHYKVEDNDEVKDVNGTLFKVINISENNNLYQVLLYEENKEVFAYTTISYGDFNEDNCFAYSDNELQNLWHK